MSAYASATFHTSEVATFDSPESGVSSPDPNPRARQFSGQTPLPKWDISLGAESELPINGGSACADLSSIDGALVADFVSASL